MIAKVVIENISGRALIQTGNTLYIIPAQGFVKNQEMSFEPENGVEVPSILYGIAMMFKDDFPEAVKFIKKNF